LFLEQRLQGPALFQTEGKIRFLYEYAVALGLFAEFADEIHQRVSIGSIVTRRSGGVHALDVFFAREKA